MDRPNFYLILELEPSLQDLEQIKTAIQKKKVEWSRLRDIPTPKGVAARENLHRIDEIYRVMLDPSLRKEEAKRAEEAIKEARQNSEKVINQDISLLAMKGYFTELDIKKIANKYAISEEMVKNRLPSGIPIKPIANERQQAKGEDMSAQIRRIERNLPKGQSSLYEFLKESSGQSLAKLHDKCSALYKEFGDKKDTAGKELASAGMYVFQSEERKKLYDDSLKYKDINEMISLLGSGGVIMAVNVNDILNRLVGLKLSQQEALEYFKSYCQDKDRKYSFELPGGGGSYANDLVICGFCNKALTTASERCTNCGELLVVRCPHCSTENSSSNNACKKCGKNLNQLKTAVQKKVLARKYLNDNNFEQAENALIEAESLWPNNPEINQLKTELQSKKNDYLHMLKSLTDKIGQKMYYSAEKELNRVKARYPSFSNAAMENSIRTQLQSAGQWVSKAQAAPASQDKVQLSLKALEICADCEAALQVLRANPPLPPSALSISQSGNGNVLKWASSKSSGVTNYKVIRKENAIPRIIQDGEELCETSNLFYEDKKVKATIPYYYSVFALRGGIHSPALQSNSPVISYRDVKDVRIIPGDSDLTISWNSDSLAKDVEIWRKENGIPAKRGDGIKIKEGTINSCLDSNLSSNKKYGYRIISVYESVNGLVYTDGVCCEGMPMSLPEPIHNISLSRDEGGRYYLRWGQISKGSVHVFYSVSKKLEVGTVLPLNDLDKALKSLVLTDKFPNGCKFDMPEEVIYIYPVTMLNSIGVVGEPVRVAILQEVENLQHAIEDNKLNLDFSWTGKAKRVLVLYKLQGFPAGPEDEQAGRIVVSYPENRVVINNIEKKDYYITVFAIYGAQEKPLYSSGKQLMVKNSPLPEIQYKIKPEKTLLGKYTGISITIKCIQAVPDCPEISVVKKSNSLPLSKTDGLVINIIKDALKTRSSYSVLVRDELSAPKTFYRLFFEDDKAYERFKLISPDAKCSVVMR